MGESRVGKTGVTVLAAAVLALVAVLIWLSTRDANGDGEAAPTARPAADEAMPPAIDEHGGDETFATGRPVWRPGMEHWYGDDPDPFIRQPLDYDMDTPKILGNRISYHVYDLETVQDMVRRGNAEDSEIARVKGRPLTEAERQAARRAIQAFFDETVPVVDGIIAGATTRDEGYDFIGPRRRRLNRELREALGLSQDAFYKIWPHVREVDDNLDRLRESEPGDQRPGLPQDE